MAYTEQARLKNHLNHDYQTAKGVLKMMEMFPNLTNPLPVADLYDQEHYVQFECGTRMSVDEASGKLEMPTPEEIARRCERTKRFNMKKDRDLNCRFHATIGERSDVRVTEKLYVNDYVFTIETKAGGRWSGLSDEAAVEQLMVMRHKGVSVPDSCFESIQDSVSDRPAWEANE